METTGNWRIPLDRAIDIPIDSTPWNRHDSRWFYLIQDVLRHEPGVMWMDSSVRFKSNAFHIYHDQLRNNSGILLFGATIHSNFAVTNPAMYS